MVDGTIYSAQWIMGWLDRVPISHPQSDHLLVGGSPLGRPDLDDRFSHSPKRMARRPCPDWPRQFPVLDASTPAFP